MSTATGSSASHRPRQRNPTLSQDRHAASTDGPAHHVPALKKKNRRTNSEVSAQHVSISTPPISTLSSTPTDKPFDARSILPGSKPQKSLSKLLEASSSVKKHTRSQTYSFQCIDGSVRTYNHESSTYSLVSDENRPTSSQKPDVIATQVPPGDGPNKEQFTAFGIEAFRTRAALNEICYDFVSTQRWCPHGNKCNRIHPLHKWTYLATAVQESVRHSRMRFGAESSLRRNTLDTLSHQQQSRDSATGPDPNHSQVDSPPTAQLPIRPSQIDVSPTAIRVKVPAVSAPLVHSSTTPPSSFSQTPTSEKAPRSRHHAKQPEIKARPQQDEAGRRNDGSGMRKTPWGDRAPSDTSSSNGSDDGATTLYPAHARFWEVYTEASAWYSDDDEPPNEVQTFPQKTAGHGRRVTSPASKPSASDNVANPLTGQSQAPRGRNGAATTTAPKTRHPRPKNNERCINWLRDRCDRGYDCKYIHDDLDYDDDEPEPSKPSFVDRLPQQFQVSLHNHMHLRFGPGFEVTDFTTGFESRWIFVSGLPKALSEQKLNSMLRPFGEVVEIRRPTQPHLLNPLTVKVQFAKASEAYKAYTTLHNSIQFGQTVESRMSVDTKAGGTFIKDTVVRIDWEGPCRNVYMGYASEELAQQAIDRAKHTPYGDFMTQATMYSGIPAVGRVTVKFTGLPLEVTEEGMEIFGAHQGMVTQGPNYKDHTLEETIKGVKKLLNQFHGNIVEVEVRAPPYREGRMRAWAYFSTPGDAQKVAENLHGRKPAFTGHTRIMARHIKTISFSLAPHRYEKAAAEIRALSEQIWRQGGGYSLSVLDKQTLFTVRLCGEDMKVLGRLKSELERMLNGDPLLENGKVAWDDFFGRPSGVLFLQDLERQYKGVKIDKNIGRRSIRLFGISEDRRRVRERILQKMAQLRLQKSYIIPLHPRLTAALQRGDYPTLQKKLGPDNVVLDLWRHQLRIRGDVEAHNTAMEIVNAAKMKQQAANWNPSVKPVIDECPVCFDEVSRPVKLACGHSWCRSCLQRYLKASVEQKFFPLACLGNEAKCTERIPLMTAREVLQASDFDAVVKAAFSSYVQTHADEYHFCPTPDCPQVYRAAQEGVFIQCPSCLVRICPSCHTDAHDGLTCMESKHGEDLFQDWAEKHGVKKCPGCSMGLEKDEGCNHMVCTMCKTHICWVCLETFPNGEGIYGHMRSEHGDWGLGPIV